MIAFFKTNVYSLLNGVLRTLALILIAAYRAVGSLWLSGQCRFEPSCSVYAQEAIERHGFWVGGRLMINRLARCRPGGGCGHDPVPLNPTANVTDDKCELRVLKRESR